MPKLITREELKQFNRVTLMEYHYACYNPEYHIEHNKFNQYLIENDLYVLENQLEDAIDKFNNIEVDLYD